MNQKFISFEGIEGVGKSTVMQGVKEILVSKGMEVICTREPGGTKQAELIRQLLLRTDREEVLHQDTELLLMFASRVQHLHRHIIPHLQQGYWVLSDRFVDASYAYQGGGRGIETTRIDTLSEWCLKDFKPDLTFLLDAPVCVALSRMQKRGQEKDRIEQEKVEFFERVRRYYLQCAAREPTRIKVVSTEQSIDAVINEVVQHLFTYQECLK